MVSLIIPRVINYETWKHYVKDKILDPLGMTRTRFYYSDYVGLDGPTENDINRTSGYVERAFPEYESVIYLIDPVKHTYEYLQISSAAGCMFSTAREMSYFFTYKKLGPASPGLGWFFCRGFVPAPHFISKKVFLKLFPIKGWVF